MTLRSNSAWSSKNASADLRRSMQATARPTNIVTPRAQMAMIEKKRFLLDPIVRTTSLLKAFIRNRPTYHSISSTGTGSGLTVISTTLPLAKRMSRSAMGASAELCVTMTTVMPSSWHRSCRSLRICLPVL